jgi:peptidyl-prolyl cis-trans isomerase D
MISWIQTRFKKHTKVVLAFLLVAVAIPFVFSINGGLANWWNKEGATKRRDFFGHNIASQVEMRRLTGDVRLSTMLQVGYLMPAVGSKLEEAALARAAALALAHRQGIAPPEAAEIRHHIAGMRLFADANGQFDPKRYEAFRAELRNDAETSEADIARVISDDIRVRRVERLLAGPGYVSPLEVDLAFSLSATQWYLQAAVFDLGGVAEPPAPSEEALAAYFAAHPKDFEIPERVSADYVRFPRDNFLGTEPVLDDEVVEYFERNRGRFASVGDSPNPGRQPALFAIRPQVEAALRAERAEHLAEAEAWNFVTELFEQRLEHRSAVPAEMIARHKGETATAPLFERKAVPPGVAWTSEIVEGAFDLNAERFYSDVLPFGRDFIVLLWRESIPRRSPLFEEVRLQVLSAYAAQRRQTELLRLGRNWKKLLAERLAAGLPLENACADLGGGTKPQFCTFGPFTRRQPPDGLPETILAALGDSPALALTDLILDKDKGYFVYVAGKRKPRTESAGSDYVQTGARLRANAAAESLASLVKNVVQAELARTEEK